MSFTRTESGVANYSLFFGVDLVIFVEGKLDEILSDEETSADEIFYKTLIKKILPNKEVKIKCVGNCNDVAEHVQKLVDAGASNGFGIIDRDGAEILYSFAHVSKRIILTNGYSWENDLWSEQVIQKSAARLIFAKDNNLYERIKSRVLWGMRRLKLLCRLDFASRVHGKALFKKNGKSCGIGLNGRKSWVVPFNEIKRLIKSYQDSSASNCNLSKAILNNTKALPSDRLVQGHLKNSLVCNIIASAFQTIYKKSSVNHTVIMNTALSLFSDDPQWCLGEGVYGYYEQWVSGMLQA